ncbi:excinuclease ABC subunit C [Candidatus Kaiserbacteria bacterium CG10_big_fil_rev_8_21_14_0_10_59_10]|uniref:Excinuclease ABC subunit C n=1 Tax=Candidatus Kaiserbacteria bacterium CG10_big_fil_rev_8_21_14_0_10_59_10 TaxID=1974612 RepID=A0A2H0U9V1_9BACT|nr:MAG: excinuclease ABC subunit C [Candidatus Kaiserbacteria bacterium CG10_big_fil_rev_8_21_14_0_10_59_10]
MYYVYVLGSERDSRLYIGRTNDLRRRLKKHNNGESFSTAFRRPFTLLYYEAYRDERDAVRREKALKLRGNARRFLMERLSFSLQ